MTQKIAPLGSQVEVFTHVDDTVSVLLTRGRKAIDQIARIGPNLVHAAILRGPSGIYGKPFTWEDLGVSENLKTTVGMDWLHEAMGGKAGFGVSGTIATASSATSLTATGTPFVASAYIGSIVVAEEGTNAPVWANIGANTNAVLTVDAWYNGDDSAGATPGATANYFILQGRGAARYIGLTTNVGAPAVGDTVLTGEITTNGLQRALAAFAHTGGTTTYTLSKTFAATGTHTAVHKAGAFTAGTNAAAGILVYNTVLNNDATLASGDSVAVTWTVTLPAAG